MNFRWLINYNANKIDTELRNIEDIVYRLHEAPIPDLTVEEKIRLRATLMAIDSHNKLTLGDIRKMNKRNKFQRFLDA